MSKNKDFRPKSRIDSSQRHRAEKKECEERMEEIKLAKPEDYFNDKEWKELNERVRQANHSIESYERSIDRGAKF